MSVPRWRAMRTAPKDGTYILLAYPSFADLGESVSVGYATWVDTPHYGAIKAAAEDALRRSGLPTTETTIQPPIPHWEIAHISNTQKAGFGYNGKAYIGTCTAIHDPVAWMPCPKPPKPRKSL